ncbi:hypothetical protein ACVWYH_002825 [Bradyrhizobium sp. GM24.11]
MPTAGSMSPTARTIAFRCSMATANMRRSGTICTALVRCAVAAGARARPSSSASSAPAWPSTARCPISARGCQSWTPRESASRGSAARKARASPAESFWHHTRHRAGFEGRYLHRRSRRHRLEDELSGRRGPGHGARDTVLAEAGAGARLMPAAPQNDAPGCGGSRQHRWFRAHPARIRQITAVLSASPPRCRIACA